MTNVFLMLYLICDANRFGAVENRLKLQKLVFLSQKRLIENKLKAFGYNFFRWHKGPFSKYLSVDLDAMCEAGFLTEKYDKIELTPKGRAFLQDCSELIEENNSFLRVIDRIVRRYGKIPPDELKELVYNMKVVVPHLRQKMAIRDIPPGQLILFKTADKNAEAIFDLDSSWVATLELYFDSTAMKSLEQAVDDAVEGRVYDANIRSNPS